MSKPKIAFVVGHSNWGKSKTLRALTNGDRYKRRLSIQGVEFLIRRMSNDDLPKSFIRFMESVDPSSITAIIAALCPNFDDEEAATQSVLNQLRSKGYRLFFWVMEHQYRTNKAMSASDISRLRKFGTVKVISGVAEAASRARDFRKFITDTVLA
ncbi:hypothetical protein [Ralstonia solanacearum]|uniref:hypothetical protein n=1 Tax=Ralstonia solanacearum TaxID=305 RepID=UPI0012FD0484|nr:hypothetical protein [Ralstonia solanacearum]